MVFAHALLALGVRATARLSFNLAESTTRRAHAPEPTVSARWIVNLVLIAAYIHVTGNTNVASVQRFHDSQRRRTVLVTVVVLDGGGVTESFELFIVERDGSLRLHEGWNVTQKVSNLGRLLFAKHWIIRLVIARVTRVAELGVPRRRPRQVGHHAFVQRPRQSPHLNFILRFTICP